MSKFLALIPAAGSGSRMGNDIPKQYLSLSGKPMIYHAIHTLCKNPSIAHVLVVLSPHDTEWNKFDWSKFSDKLNVFRCGGATRADSVLNGLIAAQHELQIDPEDWILVHDAARPCLSRWHLDKLIDELANDAVGGLLAVPVADTLKRSNKETRVACTEPRENLWQAQTPQMFRHALLTQALQNTIETPITDDASAVEAIGFHPKLVASDSYNFKVTYPNDLALAELILQQRNNQ
ncbi:2-C-methyl-D-erythritol 4-phosphate cytidylyltransferase [Nitrosomonas sp.]|uniref:2-C-methyl-D-erythritol 4-phosphate cytidylyltransferase n=1 Tax=Nitrosomonas sp. TaxID=42353 RepID=UPI001D1B5C20|nr:2-C-methyl-D-erythritol 4-phosphate cytidylyltransferase [Nitrosomonas sp.]MBX3615810.1 2-C-methyl-D-erythritol 4-phosphate cytidylyltransferase [Nitrosomonas sp.]